MADMSLAFDILARESRAVSGLDKVADSADRTGKQLDDLQAKGAKAFKGLADSAAIDGKSIGEKGGLDFIGGLKGMLEKGGLIAIGVAAGAALTQGFSSAIDQEAANDKLAAQLGLPEDEAKNLGKIAGHLYAQNFGDSVAEVNDAIKSVLQGGIVSEDVDNKTLEDLTAKAINLGSAFDTEVSDNVKAAGQLMRTGLVSDANEAFDVITRGFQEGADKSGDLLDTFNEYSTKFRDLGLDAKTATGLLIQGLKAGARDSDIVADALKEFSIRGADASQASADGFKLIGLNAKQMTLDIAKGGPSASKALDTVLDRLRKTEDPVKRNAAAVALFGTQAEDLGDALFKLDPSQAQQRLGNLTGAAERLGDTLSDNAASKIESFKRTALQGLTDFIGGTVLPSLESIGGGVQNLGTIFQTQGIEGLGNVIETQAPILGEKLKTLAVKLYDWVQPQIEPLLGKAGELIGSLSTWFLEEGVPKLADGLVAVSHAAGDWLTQDALPYLLDKAPEFTKGVVKWIDDDLSPAMEAGGKRAGAALAKGILEGTKSNLENLLKGSAIKLKEIFPSLGGNDGKDPLRIDDGGGGGGTTRASAQPRTSGTTSLGSRAMGGPVLAGEMYLIGEKGPELFRPGTSGTIIPNHALPAASSNEVHLHVSQYPGEDQVSAGMRALRHRDNVLQLVGSR